MYGHQYENYNPHRSVFRYNFEKDEGRIRDTLVTQIFSHELEPGIKSAQLQLEATAGTYTLSGTTGDLIRADKRGSSMAYNFRVEELDDNSKVIIEQVDRKIVLNSNKLNKFDLMLNPDVEWSFDLDVGAAELDFDLSEFIIQEIAIDGGAAAIDLRLGTKSLNTEVNINAAASAIRLIIPHEAACRIKTATVLSSHSFSDFEKISPGVYETADFENADQQIFINLDAAVSSFKVSRK
jgi:hypothetical protein